ncbi:MAG: hypothetical protein ACRDM7_02885, partial [Thermoleophilaceae bacterium]
SLPRSEEAEEFGPHETRRLVGNRQRLIRALRRRRVRIRRRLRNKNLEGFERRSLRRELGDVPFDIASARLDMRELRQADVGEREGPDVARLIAQLGQLKLALGIQGAQMSVLGGFRHGIRFVPETGLGGLHKGEMVLPEPMARKVRGGDGAFTPPLVVNVIVEDGAVDTRRIRAEAVRASDMISSRIGSRASERARARRF